MSIEKVPKDDVKKTLMLMDLYVKDSYVRYYRDKLHKLFSLLLLKQNYWGGLLPVGIRKGGRVWTSALFIVFGFPFIGNQSQAC